jgi:hypothetical protein
MGIFCNDDIETLEQGAPDPLAAYSALQRAINAGMWSLQGSYGRAMMTAIEEGHCMLGQRAFRDAYGHDIPSREDVQPGTKGSLDFVIDSCGLDWARQMEAA